MKIILLVLVVALGVGCGEKKKSDNPHDIVWIPEKLSKEDSLHGQGHMMDSSEFYRNDSLFYVGKDAAKTGKFEPDNPLPWAMDMVATDKNGKIVEVVRGYEYSIINYKAVPEKGVFVDTTIWDDGFGYKNYFINILKDRRLIAKIKFDIHDCAQLKDYEVLVDKKYIDKLKSGVVRYGTNPNNPKPFRPMGIRGKSKSYYLPRSTMAERLWNKSAQVKNDTLIREGDNGMEYYDGKEWKTIHYDSIQMSTSEYNKFLERWWKQSKTKLVWQVGDSGVKLPKGTSPEKYNSKNDTGYDWKFSDTALGIEYLEGGKWKFRAEHPISNKYYDSVDVTGYNDHGYTPPRSYNVYWTRSGCFSKEQFVDTVYAKSVKGARRIFQKRLDSWPKVFMIFNTVDSVKINLGNYTNLAN